MRYGFAFLILSMSAYSNDADLFKEGAKHFEQFEYQKAMQVLSRFLKSEPNHIQARILMAKTYYRLDMFHESFRLFRKLDLLGLNIETTYEYALSHFFMRQYDRALHAFKRIPEGHALYDLSNYYGGIAALQLGRLIEAESMMEKAVVLPQRLRQSQSLYRKHIVTMMYLAERKGLKQEALSEKKRIERKIDTENSVQQLMAKADSSPQHRGFMIVHNAPSLGASYTDQIEDLHAYGERRTSITSGYIQVEAGPLLSLSGLRHGLNTAALGLQLTGRAEEIRRNGIERYNMVDHNIQEISRVFNQERKVKSHSKYGLYRVDPWFEIPLGEEFWFALGGHYQRRMPDFKRTQESGSQGGFLLVGSKVKNKNLSVRYDYADITNANKKVITTVHLLDGTWLFLLPYYFSIETSLKHQVFQYPIQDPLDGPGSISSAGVHVLRDLPLSFLVGARGDVQLISDMLRHNYLEYDVIRASGQAASAKIHLGLNINDMFTLEISQSIQHTTWDVKTQGAELDFKQNEPDIIHRTAATAALRLVF